jgi:hypothetical protein
MTTTLAPAADLTATRRQEAAAILRAVADLIEARPDLPEPDTSIRVYLSAFRCGDVPAALADITAAVPGPWTAKVSQSGSDAWLDLARAATGSTVTKGTTLTVSAPAKETCAPSGVRTVTTWQLLPAVAALIAEPAALGEL